MTKDEQEIRNLIESWLRATREGDVDTVLSLMEPDVIFLVPDKPPMAGREAFGAALRAALGKHAIQTTSTIDEISVCGDIAYSRTHLDVTVISKHDGLPMRRSGNTLSILRRGADGKWRLYRDANMVVPS
ncbi:hypothetical protein GCM10027321_09570 [Massilia terrae]|uniref:SgcJ/EcaC family oxidoreductase n=1 Tax=Massilia terrae TaxID=1811224 RepID=A0ABT2CZT1_9BURK|nr:SgcJ/EcaC family oxidoreductase [Massilia terrae]MCS0659472.1 SgcJ/EcaC family oxidoreductase [Massilia terrae]